MPIKPKPFFLFQNFRIKSKVCIGVGLMFSAVVFLSIASSPKAVSEVKVIQQQQQIEEKKAQSVIKPKVNVPQASKKVKIQIAEIPVKEEVPIVPVDGEVVLGFGWNEHPVYKDWRFHNGIDIKTVEGARIKAVLSGTVKKVYKDEKLGLTVVVNTPKYEFIYGSLSSTHLKPDNRIQQGEDIGAVGTLYSEPYPHLHLSIKKGEKHLNPAKILK